jgi:sialate O-acetylesterase
LTSVPIIDLYAPFEGKSELVPDMVHPNAAGAKVIAETVRASLSEE